MSQLTLKEWILKVNAVLEAKVGLALEDLPDCCYADWHEDGVSPSTAARMALDAADF